jgi:predicted DNA-binding protein YlxM (UPF0122 family)
MKRQRESRVPKPVQDRVVALYVDDVWSMERISTELSLSKSGVRNILKQRGIQIRTMSEAARLSR